MSIAVALSLLAALLFALGLVLTQYGVGRVPAQFGACISVPTAALLFWLAAPWQLDPSDFDATAVAIFAAVGLLYPAVATVLTFEANRRMGPAVAGALGNLAPLFAVTIAILLLGETLSWQGGLGLVAVVGGVTLLSQNRRWLAGSWPVWLLALPLAAAAIRGIAQPAIKLGLAYWPSPFAAFVVGYLASTVMVLIIGWRHRPARLDRRGVAMFAAVGLANGLATYTLYAALQHGPVTLVSPLVASYPLMTVALSMLLLRQARLSALQIGGIALSVGGVALLLLR